MAPALDSIRRGCAWFHRLYYHYLKSSFISIVFAIYYFRFFHREEDTFRSSDKLLSKLQTIIRIRHRCDGSRNWCAGCYHKPFGMDSHARSSICIIWRCILHGLPVPRYRCNSWQGRISCCLRNLVSDV